MKFQLKVTITLATCLVLTLFSGCGQGSSSAIHVISREDGSGTRGAFTELFALEEKNMDGTKTDLTTLDTEITNSTSVILTSVASDPQSIGYLSLGSLNDTIKTLKINGVAPSAAAILDGSYAISRPFNIVTKDNSLGDASKDFIRFILSADGQAVVENKGYVPIQTTEVFQSSLASGKITIAGSSSVTPVMETLQEAYLQINTNATIELQQSDSTTGANSVIEGISEIGMISRDIKDSEAEKGLTPIAIAMDGIVVVVNKNNTTTELTKEQVKDIYSGTITNWDELF